VTSYLKKPIKIKLEDLRQVGLKDLFLILEEVFIKLDIQFYVLGALARDAWYAKEKIKSRTTRDVDLALYVFSGDQYQNVINILKETYDFVEVKNVPFRLQTPFGYTIDLIPFGEISIDDAVQPDKDWKRPVFVNGFEEIYKNAVVPVEIENEEMQFRIATLAAIVMLKLIAFDDRPENRTQDPQDIRDIILNFFDIESDVIYEQHNDLFDQDLELHEYAAIVIGREIKDILASNDPLRKRLLQILSLKERTQKRMADAMVQEPTTLEQVNRWFTFIKEEIE
jgi:predicted nucleotidyltransferase